MAGGGEVVDVVEVVDAGGWDVSVGAEEVVVDAGAVVVVVEVDVVLAVSDISGSSSGTEEVVEAVVVEAVVVEALETGTDDVAIL